jgi:hypothetical protein
MGEHGFGGAVRLSDDGLGQVQGHDQYGVRLDGADENLDPVTAVLNLLAHAFGCLSCPYQKFRSH